MASNSSAVAMDIEELEEKLNSTVDNKDRINKTLESFIGMINSVSYSYYYLLVLSCCSTN